MKKVIAYFSERGWRDWFSNPCHNIKSPIGDLIELLDYGATHCWCCSFLRGAVYGAVAVFICEIALKLFLR